MPQAKITRTALLDKKGLVRFKPAIKANCYHFINARGIRIEINRAVRLDKPSMAAEMSRRLDTMRQYHVYHLN